MSDPVETRGSKAMQQVAEHYALELDAQFRTLNHFATQAGEVGRAHEIFLRGVLTRFLPGHLRIGSGFVAAPTWTSKQQDILLYQHKFTRLFEVGECVVIDHEAFVGAVEVKTVLPSSNKVDEAISFLAELRKNIRQPGFYALYGWEAVSLEAALEGLWSFVRSGSMTNADLLPDVIYIRGAYFLMGTQAGDRKYGPFRSWRIGGDADAISDGQALLGLASSVWTFGLREVLPWWLLSWHAHLGIVPPKSEMVLWPGDLKNR